MTDPTETHPFTFGCYRAAETPDVDAGESTPAEATPVTDGGVADAGGCPSCGGALANVQGVHACTNCTWNAR